MSVQGGALRVVDGVSGALDASGSRDWFTAIELAELGLPGLPGDKRSMNRRMREENWLLRVGAEGEPLCRPRPGRGGGTEFHVSLLPGAARLELARRGLTDSRPEPELAEAAREGSWRWFDAQSAKTKAEAHRRLDIVAQVDLLEQSGMTRTAAIAEAMRTHGVSRGTIWNYLKAIDGVSRADWLPALAPRHRGGGKEAEIDEAIWLIFRSDMLRASAPTLAACYDRCVAIAAERGISLPSQVTFRRRFEREVHPSVVLLARKGEEALRRSMPAQRRTVDHLHAMEWVNIDGHKFDVWVIPPVPNAKGEFKPIRPVLVGIQDVRSSKVLAWRVGETETAALARLAFADLFANYGIPLHCVLDNGRGFASKWLTGGALTRYRFKILAEEPTGILTALGVGIHWALPYRGQSKPIERAWRDLCSTISQAPATEGAYTGNSPVNKPHNYASKAMGWDEFVAHVARGVAFHNSKLGRTGRDYRGRCFDEVFAESYASAPIAKATEAQLRMALLAAEQKRVNLQTGEIDLFGNRYWSEGTDQLRGQKVTVRFDPDHLTKDIHLYDLDGQYLTSAQSWGDVRFDDANGARQMAKRWADHRRRVRDGLEAEQLLRAEQVAALQADAPEFVPPEPSVVRPVRHRGQTAAALKGASAPRPSQQEDKFFAAFGKLKLVE